MSHKNKFLFIKETHKNRKVNRMTEIFYDQRAWTRTRDDLVNAMEKLGFSAELGEAVAKNLGSPKAMERMISYLNCVNPRTEELVVDEMLAILSDIKAWREKKAGEEANAGYNEILNYGLTEDDK